MSHEIPEEINVNVNLNVHFHRPARRRGSVVFRVGPVSEQGTVPTPSVRRRPLPCDEESSMSVVLKDTQMTTFAIASAKDKKGNDVPLASLGAFTWAADDAGALLALTPSADTLSCGVAAVGPLGTAKLSCSNADGTVGGSADLEVVSSAAVTVTLTNTPPVDTP